MNGDAVLDRAEVYLERERQILLSGKIKELAGLEEMREAVLSSLAADAADTARLERLRAMADRNATLLRASAEGIDNALKRLKDLRKAAGPIGSYSARGERCEIGSLKNQFERKA